ncbi:hypothetical protein BVG19_g4217 [[Candida] boidinii]|nr:hypothetical protein BVG19_g4217 [[Candida] boidinii]OWB53091.1 hydrolase activity protein [[Candida] boidinii]
MIQSEFKSFPRYIILLLFLFASRTVTASEDLLTHTETETIQISSVTSTASHKLIETFIEHNIEVVAGISSILTNNGNNNPQSENLETISNYLTSLESLEPHEVRFSESNFSNRFENFILNYLYSINLDKLDQFQKSTKDINLVLLTVTTIGLIIYTSNHILYSKDNTTTERKNNKENNNKSIVRKLMEGVSDKINRTSSLGSSFFSSLTSSSLSTLSANSPFSSNSSPFNTRHSRDDPVYAAKLKEAEKRGGLVGGLYNDGNTCFMNSVLQSLASSNELMDFLDNYTNDKTEGEDNNNDETKFTNNNNILNQIDKQQTVPFSIALNGLLEDLNSSHFNRTVTYKTKSLLKVMANGPNKHLFLGYNQEDAQEFYQSVMKQIEKEYTEFCKKEKLKNEGVQIISDEKEKNIEVNNNGKKEDKFVDFDPNNMIIGLEKLGAIGDIYVPAIQIDPSYPEADKKVYPLRLMTPVDGLQCERIGCTICGEVGGIRYSVISGLGLSLPSTYNQSYSLYELLDSWVEEEIIDGVECNRCGLIEMKIKLLEQIESCKDESGASTNEKLLNLLNDRLTMIDDELSKPIINDETYAKLHVKNLVKKSRKIKQIYFSRPPPLLCIHINRSVFDLRSYTVRKNNAQVEFPLHLDLSKYVAGPNDINLDARLSFRKQDEFNKESQQSQQSEDGDANGDANGDEVIQTKHEAEEENEIKNEIQTENGLKYSLKSVISHYGTHNYGHYIAFRKYRGIWWRISDETVRVSEEREVLSSQGTFMLFYELSSRNDPRDEIDISKLNIENVPESTPEDDENERTNNNDDDSDISSSGPDIDDGEVEEIDDDSHDKSEEEEEEGEEETDRKQSQLDYDDIQTQLINQQGLN